MTSTDTKKRRMAREPKTETSSQAGGDKTAARANGGRTNAPAPDRAIREVSPKKPNKSELVLDLLRRQEGATLDELVATTGWLPHTARAALTGLRKKGHAIERRTTDGISRYAVTAGQS